MTLAVSDNQEKVSSMPQNPYAPRPDLKIWVDHGLVDAGDAKISVFDHGLLYGDGVFEGIRVYHGKIFKEKEHIRRLFESAKTIRLEIPMTSDDMSSAMYATMDANGITEDGYIRLVVTRGVGSLGISVIHTACPTFFVIADKIALYPPEAYERGLRCIISSYTRNHPNSTSPRVKSLNYLNNVMAKLEAHDADAEEAILLTAQGRVSECSGDNIFIVYNGVIRTPPKYEGILDGITRGLAMELAVQRGFEVVEEPMIRHDVYTADECFVTGTAAEIVPIVEVDKRPIGDGKPGPITKQLIRDFVAYRQAY